MPFRSKKGDKKDKKDKKDKNGKQSNREGTADVGEHSSAPPPPDGPPPVGPPPLGDEDGDDIPAAPVDNDEFNADLEPEYDPPDGTEVTVVVPEDESGSVGMEVEEDCSVTGFTDGSTAKQAGIALGSVIIAVNGTQCRNKTQLIELIVGRPEEETDVEFTLVVPADVLADLEPPPPPPPPPSSVPRAMVQTDAPAQLDEPTQPPTFGLMPAPEPEPEAHLPSGQWGSRTDAAPTVQKLEWRTGASWDGQTRGGWYEGTGRMTYYEGSQYKGTYANGKRHGTGTARLANGDSYDGTWAFGQFHGMGRYRWANGDEYIGPFENGKEQGKGGVKVWVGEDGTEIGRYEGDWRAGHRHGIGVYIWGERMHQYDGDWTDDTPHGEGTAVLGDGSAYTGTWHRGKRHGQGKERMADGSEYIGGWANDLREGFGELVAPAGCSYRGDWVKGRRHGHGRAVMRKGGGASEQKIYEGGWANDECHGKGVLACEGNRKYDGQWNHGKRHGYGVYQFKDGSRYEGNWRNDHRSGFGTLFLSGVSEYEGTWSDGSYIEGTTWRRQHQHAPRERIGQLDHSSGWSGEAPMIPSDFRASGWLGGSQLAVADGGRRDTARPALRDLATGYGGESRCDEPRIYRASNLEQLVSPRTSRGGGGKRRGASADFTFNVDGSDRGLTPGRHGGRRAEDRRRDGSEYVAGAFDPTHASG